MKYYFSRYLLFLQSHACKKKLHFKGAKACEWKQDKCEGTTSQYNYSKPEGREIYLESLFFYIYLQILQEEIALCRNKYNNN